MKLLRHGPAGRERPGILDRAGQVRDLSYLIDDSEPELLASGFAAPRDLDMSSLPTVPDTARLGSPLAYVGKFVCIGLNYRAHAAESGMEIPAEPIVFMKATSAICGPNDAIVLPPTSTKADWEGELGVGIGKEARYSPLYEAM